MAASVYSRTVQKAVELLGGRDRLAKVLQVPRAELDRWIADEAKPPRDMFLRLVDLILDESAPPRGAGDEQGPPPSRSAADGSERYFD